MEKHDLHHEFPQYEEKIHELKTSNAHFRKLFDEYHEVNKKIQGLESTGVFDDQEISDLKFKRINLKDDLYGILEGEI